MADSNREKRPSDNGRLLLFPGVRSIPSQAKTVDSDNADAEESDRLALIESQREALKAYFRKFGADSNKVIGDAEHCNVRIVTPNGEVPIIEFMSNVLRKKPVLKQIR